MLLKMVAASDLYTEFSSWVVPPTCEKRFSSHTYLIVNMLASTFYPVEIHFWKFEWTELLRENAAAWATDL